MARGFATAPEKRRTGALPFLSLHSVLVIRCQCRLCVPMFSSTELPVSFSSSYHQGYETGPVSSIVAHTLPRSLKGIEPTWRRCCDTYAVTVNSGLCRFTRIYLIMAINVNSSFDLKLFSTYSAIHWES